MSVRALLTGFILVPALACGSDSTKKNVDGSIIVKDGSGSGSGTDAAAACSALASYSPTLGSGTDSQQAFNTGADSGTPPLFTESNDWQGLIGQTPLVVLDIELFGGGGAGSGSNPGTPDWPTDLGPKNGIDLATAADAGVAILANINTQTGAVGDVYFATTGTLNVTAASKTTGQTMSGTATGMTLVHGSFGSDGTFTPDPDGCQSTIANVAFSAKLQPPMFTAGNGVHVDNSAMHEYLTHRFK